MHNLKPGYPALIVGAFRSPRNIGKTCELVEQLAAGQSSNWTSPEGCRVRSSDYREAWIVIGEGVEGWSDSPAWADSSGWALVDPKHLMPLRGDFAPERQKSQELPA